MPRPTLRPDNMKPPSVSLLLGLAVLLFGLTGSADRSVVLELPKLPVVAGGNVTLRCKTRDGAAQTVYFFRNGSFLGNGFTGEFTISDVQRSHEGLYWCSTGLFSTSSKKWLSVRVFSVRNSLVRLSGHEAGGHCCNETRTRCRWISAGRNRNSNSKGELHTKKPDFGRYPLDPGPSPLSVVRLLCHLVVFCPYCISTVLMVSVYCSKRAGNKPAVSMEMEDQC